MAVAANPLNNSDCSLVARLWNLLSKPESGEYYLGNIIGKGLSVPSLGINIAPFPTVAIGDIPEQTMFKWALEYMGIALTGNQLSGLNSFSGGQLVCTPVSETETTVDLTLTFQEILFSGNYDVGVSGASGCAIATGAAILGGLSSSSRMLAVGGDESRLGLASWFRDGPLEKSENGKTAVGAYYLHQDAVQAVTTADNNASKQYRAKLAQQKATSDNVTAANKYYQDKHEGKQPVGNAPTMGASSQYGGGFATYVSLQQATQRLMEQRGLRLAPNDNEFAELMNAMTQFNGQVKNFQVQNPGERTTEQVMNFVETAPIADSDTVARLTGEPQGIPVFHPETDEIIGYQPTWPLDMNRIRLAHAARAEQQGEQSNAWFHIKGSFRDTAQQISLRVVVSFRSTGTNKLMAEVKTLGVTMQNLHIDLAKNEDFDKHPGLYDQVASWIGNTQSFQDTLKSQLSNGLNQQSVKDSLSSALNGGLKKLGLQ